MTIKVDWSQAPEWASFACGNLDFMGGPVACWTDGVPRSYETNGLKQFDFLSTRSQRINLAHVRGHKDAQIWAQPRPKGHRAPRTYALRTDDELDGIADAFKAASIDISVAQANKVEYADVGYVLDVKGYDTLARVLTAAYEQAAVGKGKERHANNLPFDQQPMQRISDLLNDENGMAFQAMKKIQEALRLPPEARTKELLGAIVYVAGMIIWLENNKCTKPEPSTK